MPQDKLAALLEAFGRLKEKVLFKWETDTLPGIICINSQMCAKITRQNRPEHSNSFISRKAGQCAPQEFPPPTGAQKFQNVLRQIFSQDLLEIFPNIFRQIFLIRYFVGIFSDQNFSQDLLAHPNLKGFVTHAGYLSFEEALCDQTPMVGLTYSLCECSLMIQ